MDINAKLKQILPKIQKPSRYIGGEFGSICKESADIRFAFCFPDSYDIGMSNLAMQILYGLINSRESYACERVFAPWEDMEKVMREENIPLYGLENKTPLADFDIIGFTLQYELSYTNILNMLDLGNIPVYSKDRNENHPLVIAGGSCACNPAPISEFIDIFVIGEGEEVTLELLDLYAKNKDLSRRDFLELATKIEGIYVPVIGNKTKKRVISDVNSMYSPENFIVPYSEIVHERAAVEVLRGCIRGCRFCQAGFLYRPYREKSSKVICQQSEILCKNTGYEELSLLSLSTSDHSQIDQTMGNLINFTEKERINLALPSMRLDSFNDQLIEKLTRVRKSGLTFAPEAGTQRLRDVINKNITEDEIMSACETAFKASYSSVKLYFMLGLPTETDEDILGIADITRKIERLFLEITGKRGVSISVSASTFVPKPYTPFQFVGQDSSKEILRKQKLLAENLNPKRVKLSVHSPETSILEAVLARGDEKICRAIYIAWQNGAKFDSWGDFFNFQIWEKAFEQAGLNMEEYACKEFSYTDVLPWDNLDYLISKEFLISEHKKAMDSLNTPNCREKCSACGASNGRKCNIPEQEKAVFTLEEPVKNYLSNQQFFPIRAVFTKKSSASLISHLDLARTMQRIVKRSGLPVKFTEGFNPHYGIGFPLALPLGVESNCEIMDFKLEENVEFDIIKEKFNAVMPQGLEILEVNIPANDLQEMAFADYEITGNFTDFDKFMEQNEIIVQKKAKQKHRKILKDVDIKPFINALELTDTKLILRLPATVSGCITPIQIITAFQSYTNSTVNFQITKIRILNKNEEDFR